MQVVVICSTEETPQAELQLLTEVQELLKRSAEPHVMVYATQPVTGQASPTRRSLLAVSWTNQPQLVCDARCQTQVSLQHLSLPPTSGHHGARLAKFAKFTKAHNCSVYVQLLQNDMAGCLVSSALFSASLCCHIERVISACRSSSLRASFLPSI